MPWRRLKQEEPINTGWPEAHSFATSAPSRTERLRAGPLRYYGTCMEPGLWFFCVYSKVDTLQNLCLETVSSAPFSLSPPPLPSLLSLAYTEVWKQDKLPANKHDLSGDRLALSMTVPFVRRTPHAFPDGERDNWPTK